MYLGPSFLLAWRYSILQDHTSFDNVAFSSDGNLAIAHAYSVSPPSYLSVHRTSDGAIVKSIKYHSLDGSGNIVEWFDGAWTVSRTLMITHDSIPQAYFGRKKCTDRDSDNQQCQFFLFKFQMDSTVLVNASPVWSVENTNMDS